MREGIDASQSVPRGCYLSPVGLILACLLLVTVGRRLAIEIIFWEPEYRFEGLSYESYAKKCGVDLLDPKGGKDIDFYGFATRDSHENWWRLRIARSDYEALRSREAVRYASVWHGPEHASKSTIGDDPSFPKNWPGPERGKPLWWTGMRGRGPGVECTRWEHQVPGRAGGRLWIYDGNTEVLWLYEWNRQHARIGI